MKQFIKDYFTFTKQEKNGIIVLVALIVLILATTFLIGRWNSSGNAEANSIESEINELTGSSEGNNVPWDSANTLVKVQFPININTADILLLTELKGVGPALAKRIVSYRDSAGGFKSKEELLKVKGIGAKKLEGFQNEIIIEAVGQVNLADEN